MTPYPNFTQALLELAPTNPERAKLLGCSERAVFLYLKGIVLPKAVVIKRFPALDDALTRDVRPQITDRSSLQVPA